MIRTIARRIDQSKLPSFSPERKSRLAAECKRSYSSQADFSENGKISTKQAYCKTTERTPTLLGNCKAGQNTASLPSKISQPVFVDVEQIKKAFPEPTWNRMNLISPLLMSFQVRGIGNFERAPGSGNFNTAVHSLINADRVLLCTGFNVAENMPETDGPLGTALLAYACFRADKYVVTVADHHNAHLLRTQLFLLDPACARNIIIEEVKAVSPAPSGLWEDMLARHEPDAVVHTEVPGRNRDGKYLNMRGIQISNFNAALDGIADLANARGIHTIGVGDGGNEAGMGQIKGVPKALNQEEMQAVIPAGHQIIAWNSNLGAIALGEFVMSAAGKGPTCTDGEFKKMLQVLFKEGAVDGITRGSIMDQKVENPDLPSHFNFTCVDGARSAIHIGNLLHVQDIAHNIPLKYPTKLPRKPA